MSLTVYVFLRLVFQSTCPARGTTKKRGQGNKDSDISIHVPREGHDSHRTETLDRRDLFQSTCPARGTTLKHTAEFHNN